MKYMVIFYENGEPHAMFYDSMLKAENARLDATCGLDIYCEVYERKKHGEEGSYFEFIYS